MMDNCIELFCSENLGGGDEATEGESEEATEAEETEAASETETE